MRHPGARRADRGAARGRRRAAARRAPAAAARRHRHHLCDPPPRRGVPHRRSRHRAARRPPRGDRAVGRDDPAALVEQYRRPLALASSSSSRRAAAARIRARRRGARRRRCRAGVLQRCGRRDRWASSACAAPATTPSAARIFGDMPHRRRPMSRSTGSRSAIRPTGATPCATASASSRASAARRASRPSMTVRENLFMNPVADRHASLLDRPAASGASCREARAAPLFGAPAGAGARHRDALGRQPAEGRRRALDGGGGHACWCSRSRPSASMSARRRRSTSCCSEALEQGPGRAADLVGLRGGRAASAIARSSSIAAGSCAELPRERAVLARLTALASGADDSRSGEARMSVTRGRRTAPRQRHRGSSRCGTSRSCSSC